MERSEALKRVKPHLTEKRYKHTLGVVDMAVILAERFQADVEKAELAAVFHDYAKYYNRDEMRELIVNIWDDKTIIHYSDELLHAPCGAYYVEHNEGIVDPEILHAIRYHTTGRPQMTLLDKVIFLADYIEPGRQFNGVDEVRQLAVTSIDEAIIKALANTISFLTKSRQPVYPLTVATYNDLVFERKIKRRSER